jgi:hypothetical protein
LITALLSAALAVQGASPVRPTAIAQSSHDVPVETRWRQRTIGLISADPRALSLSDWAHAMLVFGSAAPSCRELGLGPVDVSALDWIFGAYAVDGAGGRVGWLGVGASGRFVKRLRADRSWSNGEAHPGQLALYLLEAVGADPRGIHPVMEEVVDSVWREWDAGQDAAYVLALRLRLKLPMRWSNRFGESVCAQSIVRGLLATDFSTTYCFGGHHLSALVLAEADTGDDFLDPATRAELRIWLANAAHEFLGSVDERGWMRRLESRHGVALRGSGLARLNAQVHTLMWILASDRSAIAGSEDLIRRAMRWTLDEAQRLEPSLGLGELGHLMQVRRLWLSTDEP